MGSVNRDQLYFRRDRGFEKPQKIDLTEDKEFKLVMRPFNPKAKECRFFVGKCNEISVNHYTSQSVYTETSLLKKWLQYHFTYREMKEY